MGNNVEFALEALGIVFHSLFDLAIECFKVYLTSTIELSKRKEEGRAYGNKGMVYNSLGKYHESITYNEKSLNIAIDIGDWKMEGNAYLELGNSFQGLYKYDKALKYIKRSRDIYLAIGSKKGQINAYINLGNIYDSLRKYNDSIECFFESLKICKEIKDKEVEKVAYSNLGSVCMKIGKHDKAIEYCEKSINTAVHMSEGKLHVDNYLVIGDAYANMGKYDKAFEYHEKSLNISNKIGYTIGIGKSFNNLGNTYQSLGKYEDAINFYEKSLSIAIVTGNKGGEGWAYGNLGSAYWSLGRYEKAKTYILKHRPIAIDIGDKKGEACVYRNLGNLYYTLCNHDEAISYHKKSLKIVLDIVDKNGEKEVYGNLGNVYHSLGKYLKAIDYFKKSLNLAIEVGDVCNEGGAYSNLGMAYYSLAFENEHRDPDELYYDNLQKSKTSLTKAMSIFDGVYKQLQLQDDLKISFQDKIIKISNNLTIILLQVNEIQEALLVSDRRHARVLSGLLVTQYNVTLENQLSCTTLKFTDVEHVLLNSTFCILFFAFHKKRVVIWVVAHENPLLCLVNELKSLKSTVCTLFPDTDQECPIKLCIAKIVEMAYQKMEVREVGDCEDRSLESFEKLTPCNKDLKVSKEPSLAFGEIDSNTNESQKNSDTQSHPVRCIEEVHGEYIDANPLELLYNELILPVLPNLQHDEVVIVPDGPLYMVPFAALRDVTTKLYLSETKRVRLAPSIAALKALQECPADVHSNTDALIVGDPEIGEVMFRGHEKTFSCLPFAKCEAEKISEVLGVKPLIGPQATKEFVLKRLQQGGIAVIHFATHGGNGEILLAPSETTSLTKSVPEERDYILTMKEVQESGIRAQLVVLSCCHSGRGEINSEGVVGMSRAFLAAGARAVVASLWAIDDIATMEFMLKFYSHLKKGDSASTSLQQAMKEMRDEEIYSEPKYWAPFFIIGDDVTIDISV